MTNFIVPYNPEWKTEFERLKVVYEAALEDFEVDVQHVGSTSIPGLHAKPILDIDIVITDQTQLHGISGKLGKLGYISRGEQGIAGRFAFRQSTDMTPLTEDSKVWQQHHLYVCFSDSLALKNHLVFRDTLLQNEKIRDAYSQLKVNLSQETGMTRERYTERKTDFILNVLAINRFDSKELEAIRAENM